MYVILNPDFPVETSYSVDTLAQISEVEELTGPDPLPLYVGDPADPDSYSTGHLLFPRTGNVQTDQQ